MAYRVEDVAAASPALARKAPAAEWVRAWPRGSAAPIELGRRIILQLAPGAELATAIAARPLALEQVVAPRLFILRAPDAATAVRESSALSSLPVVRVAHPDRRQRLALHGGFASRPNDPYFISQWHLENRDPAGSPLGPDLNVRAAWAVTRGEGVVIAQGDDGMELTHTDLAARAVGMPHFNWVTGTSSGAHVASFLAHGTAVAGLAAADSGNGLGGAGVAPGAGLASWVIFSSSGSIASDTALMNMFQHASNTVSVQNHSWGSASPELLSPSLAELAALTNAWTLGRGGKGIVICRAAGNGREDLYNANDDGYANDPRVIVVGAVRDDGKPASYTSGGACVLVCGLSGDPGRRTLFTTDRTGTIGYNTGIYTNDLADYAFDGTGFTGTSGATPQISGISALILAANPNLALRDVQQVMLLAARHFDASDSSLQTNAAGLRASHHTGFGVPDAGFAVSMARRWPGRAAPTNLSLASTATLAIPDEGLRLVLSGPGVPASLTNIPCRPSLGPHADSPTASLPLVDVGLALSVPATNLTGKAALIQRGTNFFWEKITNAALAGASFAVIYNRSGGSAITVMAGTDFVPIPAVFISQAEGEAVSAHIATNPAATARIVLNAANYFFAVTNKLLCEHVQVRVRTSHLRRSDLRITLTSPSGTRSILQHVNQDFTAGPADWTYSSVQHFFEPSAGTWTVAVSDQAAGATGNVLGVDLTLHGTGIVDTDNDGLDDAWEIARFGSLAQTATGDPDKDGHSNMREQLMGTDPALVDPPFQLVSDFTRWDAMLARLSWPASTHFSYEVTAATNVTGSFVLQTNLAGRFPELEFFAPFTAQPGRFFQIRAVPVP